VVRLIGESAIRHYSRELPELAAPAAMAEVTHS